ncbi:hypothetical protein BB561_002642 [Smittium simulii]|uniref:glutathione transferase n=1 Tax=Smittium simulii TaxID=133385 RepID=A0A2T9YPN4_9FUNG|nr:hypothetical protein BB561_002642 [Smittium simulii]
MPSYEIYYFPMPGRAFPTRCMLTLANVSYKNIIPNWPSDKPKMPYGRLPVLKEISEDGSEFTLSESIVIDRYIAQKYGFLPKDEKKRATVEQYIAQICDPIEAYADFAYIIKTEDSKKKLIEVLTYFIEKHELILSQNPAGYYYGDSITLPDIYLYSIFNA